MSVEQAATAEAALAAQPAKRGEARILGPLAVALALLSAFVTFVVLADLTPLLPTHNVVVTLLLVNAATAVLLLGIIVREVWQVVQARRSGRAGARLHVRIVGLFSIIAAAPAILVAIVASVTLDRGLDRLLSTRDLITNTKDVAEIYGLEHVRALRGDTLAMAISLSQARPLFDQDRERFRQVFSAQASLRGLPAAMLINSQRTVLVKSEFNPQLELAIPPAGAFARINDTEPQIEPVPDTNYLVAIIKMRGYDKEEVRSFLNLVSSEFEAVIVESNNLKEKLAQVESSVSDLRERERILKETLLTAQRLADEIREEARKEAQLIVREAEVKGSQLLDQAGRKAGDLEGTIQALRVEREAFAQRIRSAVEQHLRLLDMHKKEEEIEDRLRFMKKPPAGEAR